MRIAVTGRPLQLLERQEHAASGTRDSQLWHVVTRRWCGATQSRQVAKDLIADAKAALQPFPPAKAAPLVGLAEYILGRQN